jgi:hypothetical protein
MGKVTPDNISPQMQEFIRAAAQEGARIAVLEFRDAEARAEQGKSFNAMYNTKLLMSNYHRLKHHATNAVTRLSDMETGLSEEVTRILFYGGETRLEGVVDGKRKTIMMMAHLDTCLGLIKDELLDEPEKWNAFYLYYISTTYKGMKRTQKLEMVAEDVGKSDRAVRNWLNEIIAKLSCYLWGVDGLRAINEIGASIGEA